MKKYLVKYTWYEFSPMGIIEANDKDEAILTFAKLICKLTHNYKLTNKYGDVSPLSPFFYDEDSEKTLEEQINIFIYSRDSGNFTATELTNEAIGLMTNTGFYNGEDE